jgi:hypothetical protein
MTRTELGKKVRELVAQLTYANEKVLAYRDEVFKEHDVEHLSRVAAASLVREA